MHLHMLAPSLLLFALACALALASTPVVRALARRIGAIDHGGSSRKLHGRPVPRLGGLAIVFGSIAALLALVPASPQLREALQGDGRRALSLLAGGLLVAGLGVFDDLRGAGARPKLLVQVAAAGLVWWAGFRVEAIPVPFFGVLPLGPLGLPVTLLWIVGVTNAVNLLDGLDGLAAGQAVAALLAFLVLALSGGQTLLAVTAATAAGAALGFLPWNRQPATIFMGDTGSLFLGFLLGTLSLALGQAAPSGAAMVAPVIAIALPVADAILAVCRRLLRGMPVGRGDRGHLHHRVLARMGSHREAVLVLWAIAVVLALASLSLSLATGPSAELTLAALAVAGVVVLRVLGYLSLERTRDVLQERRRNLARRAGVREAAERLRTAASPEQVWEAVREAGVGALGASAVSLWPPPALWTEPFHSGAEARADLFLSRFDLLGRPGAAALELGWDDGRTSLDRDTEVAIELLCDQLLTALARIGPPTEQRATAKRAAVRSARRESQGAT